MRSFLSSTFSYKTFDFDVFAQGMQPLELLPEGNTGNYFADIRRQISTVSVAGNLLRARA